MFSLCRAQPHDDHVGAANGLDLLRLPGDGQLVERRENTANHRDNLPRRLPVRDRREADEIGED
ncbi:MAG TPA: hypothetical protein VHE61_14095 [Opitutaceae bacterium]|nr:hypothetical protein [Opitutaceae bacterium]